MVTLLAHNISTGKKLREGPKCMGREVVAHLVFSSPTWARVFWQGLLKQISVSI